MARQVLRDFIDPQKLSRLAGLFLHARQPMLGNVSGRHRSPIRGSSLEFAEYRKYVPGDDTRRLDWRAYGRSDRFYIKEFEADTNLRLVIVLDTSGSMAFEYEETSKLQYARSLAGSLAYIAANQGDAVGLACAGAKYYKDIPPRRNAAHLKNILDELADVEPTGETGLVNVLHETAERVRQRAMIVILSDLFVPTDELKDCFQHLRFRKHDVVAFHLLDQNEIDFEFNRPTRFLDLEGGAPILADPAIIGVQYRRALRDYLEALKTVMRDAAIDYHRVLLQDDYGDVLARFLIGRIPRKR
ncbi:MAG: DUF58 domain-containing protein [Pirellulaceae bacterium]